MGEKIELSSIETTSYWWVTIIKQKVKELLSKGTRDKQEIKFVEIFKNYTERDWRNLYLELNKYIVEWVNNYVPLGDMIGIDCYNQDTEQKGHNDLNNALKAITGKNVPDIRLASSNTKDSVIYTNMFGTCVWYKSCGTNSLPTKYDQEYIITGDEVQLDFNNLFLATVAIIMQKDKDFHSVPILRQNFCKIYNSEKELDEDSTTTYERFNIAFENANNKGVVLGRSYQERYFTHFREFDFVEIQPYMEEAQIYADVVLGLTEIKKAKSDLSELLDREKNSSKQYDEINDIIRKEQARITELKDKGSNITHSERLEMQRLKQTLNIHLGLLRQFQDPQHATEEFKIRHGIDQSPQKVLSRKPTFIKTNPGSKNNKCN